MKNKTKIFKMRITEDQQTTIQKKAAQAKLTPSEYVRRKVFTGEVGVMDSMAFLDEYKNYVYEIRKVGNNINQLAHYANQLNLQDKYSIGVIEEMKSYLRRLTECEMKIQELSIKIMKA